MTQLFNLKSKFWYNINLYFRAAMVASVVIGFVCVSYIDLTHTESISKKPVETIKEAGNVSKADQKTAVLDIKG